jgi:hypothetical protein
MHGSNRDVAKNIKGCLEDKLIMKLICNQTWLNLLMDHCHFSYISKLIKETLNFNIENELKKFYKKGHRSSSCTPSWLQQV